MEQSDETGLGFSTKSFFFFCSSLFRFLRNGPRDPVGQLGYHQCKYNNLVSSCSHLFRLFWCKSMWPRCVHNVTSCATSLLLNDDRPITWHSSNLTQCTETRGFIWNFFFLICIICLFKWYVWHKTFTGHRA